MGDFRRTLAAVLGKEEEDEKIALLCSKVDHLDNRKCFRMVSRTSQEFLTPRSSSQSTTCHLPIHFNEDITQVDNPRQLSQTKYYKTVPN